MRYNMGDYFKGAMHRLNNLSQKSTCDKNREIAET